MHEDFSRQEDIKPSSDRSFGLMIATVFLAVTFLASYSRGTGPLVGAGGGGSIRGPGVDVDSGTRSAQ
jgi:hypothetical protein